MASLDKALFNLKVSSVTQIIPCCDGSDDSTQFTAKQLNRQAAKAGKDEQAERNKLKKARLTLQSLVEYEG